MVNKVNLKEQEQTKMQNIFLQCNFLVAPATNLCCNCNHLFAFANKFYLHLQIFNCKKQNKLPELDFNEKDARNQKISEECQW